VERADKPKEKKRVKAKAKLSPPRCPMEARRRGFPIDLQTREVYIQAPGMIFKGNPPRYLKEIQLLLKT
jgi:hypothetical protein